LRDDPTVDQHRAVVDQCLHRRARPAGQEGERPVDPITVECRRHGDGPVDHDTGAAFGASNVRTINTMAPTVMHESATLNTGHQPTATKSTTWPRRKPGERAMRSPRLPSAPPSTNTNPMSVARSVAWRSER